MRLDVSLNGQWNLTKTNFKHSSISNTESSTTSIRKYTGWIRNVRQSEFMSVVNSTKHDILCKWCWRRRMTISGLNMRGKCHPINSANEQLTEQQQDDEIESDRDTAKTSQPRQLISHPILQETLSSLLLTPLLPLLYDIQLGLRCLSQSNGGGSLLQ